MMAAIMLLLWLVASNMSAVRAAHPDHAVTQRLSFTGTYVQIASFSLRI